MGLGPGFPRGRRRSFRARWRGGGTRRAGQRARRRAPGTATSQSVGERPAGRGVMEEGGVLPPAFPTPEGQRGPLHSQAPWSAHPSPAPAGLTRPLSPGHRGQPDRGLPAWPGKPRSDLPECSNPSPSGHIPLPSNRLLTLSPSGDRRCREPAPRSGSPVPQAGLHPSLESISETPHWAGGPCFPSHSPTSHTPPPQAGLEPRVPRRRRPQADPPGSSLHAQRSADSRLDTRVWAETL